MKKLIEFGRKAMFYVRVLSGYEERRIRSYRFQLEHRLRSAQQRKDVVKKIPEQMVLSEVRKMVEEMQTLNKRLEDMEADINEYLKPIDKEVETIINLQMEKEQAMAEMMGAMYKQAMLEKASTEAVAEASSGNKGNMEAMSAMFKRALEKDEARTVTETKDPHDQTKVASIGHQSHIR